MAREAEGRVANRRRGTCTRATAKLAFDGVHFQERAARLVYDIPPLPSPHPSPSVLGTLALLESAACRGLKVQMKGPGTDWTSSTSGWGKWECSWAETAEGQSQNKCHICQVPLQPDSGYGKNPLRCTGVNKMALPKLEQRITRGQTFLRGKES